MDEEHIRTYVFPVSGYIPGIPGMFAGGSRVTVNEETKEILDVWPKPVVEASTTEAAHAEQEVVLPEEEKQSNSLQDALRRMGG